MATPTLPTDVITCILSLLPAKFVLICKSVCKLWYDLINSPEFVKLHLERSFVHFVIRTPSLHLADFDTFDNPVELDYPFKHPDHGGAHVVGSCRGLLCLWNFEHHLSVFLYNPTTRTHRILPSLALPFPYPKGHYKFGFGYDCFSEDYKCVRIYQALHEETGSFESQVMVYSLKTDSWRRAQDVPYYFYYHRGQSAFVDGAIHWIGSDRNRVVLPIVSFDLKEETFSSIPLPNFHDNDHVHMSVGVLDGCLCLMVNYLDYYDVWIMKEYGMPRSWLKVFSIQKRKGYERLDRPISFSISRKELFLILCLYRVAKLDMETMEVTDVKIPDFRRCLDGWVCVENLLMLNDDAYDDPVSEQEQGKAKKTQKKKRRKRRRNRRL
uniref:F-box domain-containing protein n=1 Tax=Opuntia streptacantha TaxID=393608 RepID=A0A7C9ANW9_OPUST